MISVELKERMDIALFCGYCEKNETYLIRIANITVVRRKGYLKVFLFIVL